MATVATNSEMPGERVGPVASMWLVSQRLDRAVISVAAPPPAPPESSHLGLVVFAGIVPSLLSRPRDAAPRASGQETAGPPCDVQWLPHLHLRQAEGL